MCFEDCFKIEKSGINVLYNQCTKYIHLTRIYIPVTVECIQSPPTITMDEEVFESDLLKIVCVSNGHNMDEGEILLMEKKQNTSSFVESTLIADIKTGGNGQGCQNTEKSFEFISSWDWHNTEFKCITYDNQESETKRLIITVAGKHYIIVEVLPSIGNTRRYYIDYLFLNNRR